MFIFCICLYKYINKINELTLVKLEIPKLEKEIRSLDEEREVLQYEIDRFENPIHLMELARSPQFSHLKHPLIKDVLKVKEGVAIKESIEKSSRNIDNNF
jgi:hypothetical protein